MDDPNTLRLHALLKIVFARLPRVYSVLDGGSYLAPSSHGDICRTELSSRRCSSCINMAII